MAHFNFEKMLNEAIKLDGPLQNGPKFRYERKPMEKKGSESSLGTELFHIKYCFHVSIVMNLFERHTMYLGIHFYRSVNITYIRHFISYINLI